MIVTTEILARIERAEVECIEAAVVATGADPPETTFARFGGAVAYVTKGVQHSMYNRVMCLGAEDVVHLDDIVEHYAAAGVPPRFDITPQRSSDGLRDALRRRGFVADDDPAIDRRVLVTAARVHAPSPVAIRQLTRECLADWVAIDKAVWPFERGDLTAKLEATFEKQGLLRYLAYIDDKPVALGRLQIHNGIAQLNGGGTLDAYRHRGCQTALIFHRISAAKQHGCDIVTSLVGPGSQSDRNLQRCGLTIGCDREAWMLSSWREHAFFRA